MNSTTTKTIKKYFKEFRKNVFTKTGIKNIIIGSSTSRKMFRIYFLLLLIFSILLYLPISLEPFRLEGFGGDQFNLQYINNEYVMTLKVFDGSKWVNSNQTFHFGFFDCLFTAFSAFSDTGLTLAPTYQVFSTFGSIILMILIQLGGFGIMFLFFLIWKIFNRMDKVTIGQTLLAQSEKGNTKIGDTEKMLITSSIFILVIELFFGFFFSFWFLLKPAYIPIVQQNGLTIDSSTYNHLYMNPANSFLAGFFHSISSINNAGFDIISDYSLAPYRNDANALFLFMTSLEFIVGGIGFPVIYDVIIKIDVKKRIVYQYKFFKIYAFNFKYNKKHHVSLLTKISLITYFILMILSVGLTFIFECTSVGAGLNMVWNDTSSAFGSINNPNLNYFNKSWNLIFQAITTRSAGFATFDNGILNPSTKWLNIGMMYVGGAPSSTAGGIRVTTFAILVLAIWSRLLGKKTVRIHHRKIPTKNVVDSFIVSFVGIIIISIGAIIVVSNLEKGSDTYDAFSNAMYVTSSAFGTVGLSSIDLVDLNWIGKLYLMLLMFIGQYGISSTLLVFRRSKIKENNFEYMEEEVRIG